MANEGFNGTTATVLGSAQTPLVSITYDDSAAEIDVTGAGDLMHSYEAGLPNPTVTFQVVGGADIDVGDAGAVSIAWFDGVVTDAISAGVCTAVSRSGSLDDKIVTDVTVRPHSAVGTGS